MKPRLSLAAIALTFAAGAWSAELPPPADKKVVFAEDVRPILSKHCWSCHGEAKRESGLRLDERAAATAGGDLGKVIVPGKSAESRLILYVAGLDEDHLMPPEGDRLSAAEIGLLRAWIDQGLDWPAEPSAAKKKHWAYEPVKTIPLPAVKRTEWPRTAADYFVLAELERRGLSPSPEADRYTLIRRLYLDLLGLLPTIEEVDAFAADRRPEAYEALVDRLLASPHFGERWGRHWLDMARYADSDGYEKDNPRPDAFLFRDWVIAAINDDLPFDQFTIEQLAGDLLPNATDRQRLATAFHRQTLTNTEGGTDQEQFRVEACFDRTETTGAVWLGLTVGCARCHSHKYDAVTQREYYQLFAVFNNGDERTLTIPKSPAEVAAYEIAKGKHDASVQQLRDRIDAKLKERQEEYVAWERGVRERQAAQPVKLHSLDELNAKSDGDVTLKLQEDGSLLAGGENPATAVYEVTGRAAVAGVTALRLDALPDQSLPAQGPGRVKHGNFVLSEVTLEVAESADFTGARKIEFASAQADHEQSDRMWPAKNVFDGQTNTGWAIGPQYGKPHWIVLRLKEPVADQAPRYWRVTLSQQYGSQHTIGRFKVSLQTGQEPAAALPPALAKLLEIPDDKRTDDQSRQLREHFARQAEPTQSLYSELDKLLKQAPPKPEIAARTFEQRKDNPRTTYVLKRGEFLAPLKDLEVSPAGFATLPPLVARESNTKADRLDLARWLVSPDHPLTPRVTVNHVWRMLFGRGLVRTSNDFGVRGDPPSHPELLDRLAADFVGRSESGDKPWSRKALIKRIVMSAAYRQQSKHRADLAEVDPQNVLLARQSRWRVEGEVVRDISLAAAGMLSRKVGGPSVFPPLPSGVAELSYAGNFKWTESTGEDRYRRGMYTFFKRTAPHPNLTSFDCPDANLTCVERNASNTPLQALVALNNPSFVESAQGYSKRLLTSPGEDSSRLLQAFRECLGRPPRDVELSELTKLLVDARAYYAERSSEAAKAVGAHAVAGVEPREQAAWTATLRVLLNLDEFLTRE